MLVQITFANGLVFACDVATDYVGQEERWWFEVVATRGSARMAPLRVVKELNGRATDVSPTGAAGRESAFIQSYRAELAHFVAVVRDESPYEPPTDQVRLLKIVEAVYKSAEEEKEIRLQLDAGRGDAGSVVAAPRPSSRVPQDVQEDPRLDERLQQVHIDHPLLRFLGENVERAFCRDGTLVGTVGGGEGVEDVGDRHHSRLHRDLGTSHAARVACAVQLLVVPVRDLRDAAELPRPRNLLEEPERVCHVRLDLAALAIVEIALSDHEKAQLLVAEERPLDTLEIDVGPLVDLLQLVEAALGENRRLVRLDDGVEEPIELVAARATHLLEA